MRTVRQGEGEISTTIKKHPPKLALAIGSGVFTCKPTASLRPRRGECAPHPHSRAQAQTHSERTTAKSSRDKGSTDRTSKEGSRCGPHVVLTVASSLPAGEYTSTPREVQDQRLPA